MSKCSAGILLYRKAGAGIELLLVHPGGPFWARKDQGVQKLDIAALAAASILKRRIAFDLDLAP